MTTGYPPCVGSGMCCKRAPCGYGEWNKDKTACAYLEEAYKGEATIYKCGRYDYIIKQPGAEIMPAFGAGCCQPLFNTERKRIFHIVARGTDKGAISYLSGRLKRASFVGPMATDSDGSAAHSGERIRDDGKPVE